MTTYSHGWFGGEQPSEILDRESPSDKGIEQQVLKGLLLCWQQRVEPWRAIFQETVALPLEAFYYVGHQRLLYAIQKSAELKQPTHYGIKLQLNWLQQFGGIYPSEKHPDALHPADFYEILDTWWCHQEHAFYLRRLQEFANRRRAMRMSMELVKISYNGSYDDWLKKLDEARVSGHADSETLCGTRT